MKSHVSTLRRRMIRAALRVTSYRYRIAAAGIDYRGNIIAIATNSPRLPTRGWHAEERVIFNSPRSLARIVIARVGADGGLLPIDPCAVCARLAARRGIEIEALG